MTCGRLAICQAANGRASSSSDLVRDTSARDAPSLLIAAAMASPMPRPAPVITHLRPVRCASANELGVVYQVSTEVASRHGACITQAALK